MLGQGMGNLMPQHLGQLVIGGLDLLHQAAVEGHAPAGHGPGIDRVRIIDDMDAPLPAGGLGTEFDGLGNEPAGNGLHPRLETGIIVQLALLSRLLEHLEIGGLRGHDSLLLGNQQ